MQLAIFSTGSKEKYGICATSVIEIFLTPEIQPVPGAPDVVSGIVSVRDMVLTAVKLCPIVGTADAECSEQYSIVVEHNNVKVALLIDKVQQLVDVDPQTFDPAPSHTDLVKNLVMVDGELVSIINLEYIYSLLDIE